MRDNWVNWLQWGHGRLINYGQMRKDEVAGVLREFEATAAKVMEKTGADHVLYGVKSFDENGDISKVSFYMEPMTDEQFEKDTRLSNCIIYALHARR